MTTFKRGQKVRIKSMPDCEFTVLRSSGSTVFMHDEEQDTYERFFEEIELFPVKAMYGDRVQHDSFGENAVLEFIGWHRGCMVCWQVYQSEAEKAMGTERGEIRRFDRNEWDKVSINGAAVEFEVPAS
jgi:hypothetical protein